MGANTLARPCINIDILRMIESIVASLIESVTALVLGKVITIAAGKGARGGSKGLLCQVNRDSTPGIRVQSKLPKNLRGSGKVSRQGSHRRD